MSAQPGEATRIPVHLKPVGPTLPDRLRKAAGRHPLMLRSLLFLILPAAIACYLGFGYISGGLDEREGDLHLRGLSAPVVLTRDGLGVVHIEARSPNAAYFATGFAHAQDRLWQMEVQRRMASGRLAEVFGQGLVPSDAWFRSLRLYESAGHALEALSPAARESLTAYANGVNAFMQSAPSLPPQFSMYGVRPTPWTEMDSLAWLKTFAFSLSNNMGREAEAYVLAARTGDLNAWDMLHPAASDDATPITCAECDSTAFEAVLKSMDEGKRLLRQSPTQSGSNAWVVAGDPARNEGPILANDPHLGLQIPSPWYVVTTRSNGLSASGMTLVGLPVIVFGQNDAIAWGGTSMMADVQDLFVETVDPTNPTQYRTADGWLGFEIRHEEIQVRSDFPSALRSRKPSVRLRLQRSIHGPIINGNTGLFDRPVALRWTGYIEHDTSYEALFLLSYARNWQDFNSALSKLIVPAMNMVYADRGNNIGYAAAGAIPIRGGRDGAFPVEGGDEANDWRGFVPFAAMPKSFNPDSGRIVTANNKVIGEDYPYFISKHWADPARAARIEALLIDAARGEDGRRPTMDQMKRIQLDTLDLSVQPLLAILQRAQSDDPDLKQALAQLKAWDGSYVVDSPAPALFQGFVRALRKRLFDPAFAGVWGEGEKGVWMRRAIDTIGARELAAIIEMEESGRRRWCPMTNERPSAACAAIIEAALADAVVELKPFGATKKTFPTWGQVHNAVYDPVPIVYPEPLGRYLRRRQPSAGSENTINVAGAKFEEAEGYLQSFGASFRQLIELPPNGPLRHQYMNSTGQSEHPLSKHYDDMLNLFQSGELRNIDGPRTRGATRLRLLPLETSTPCSHC